MQPIHNRMPVMVPKALEGLWLAPEVKSSAELGPALQPYPAGEMEAYAVSRLVNAPMNDRPECIALA